MKLNPPNRLAAAAAAFVLLSTSGRAADDPVLKDPKNLSLRNEVQTAIDRGLDWLKKTQEADGHWSKAEHPALTALPAIAFERAPGSRGDNADVVSKALDFIRREVKPDGGIYTTGLSNYNTSVCMTALLTVGKESDQDTIEAARKFVAGQQASGMAKPGLDGGFGYGPTGSSPKRQHPDLDNTVIALEALRFYEKMRPTSELAAAKDLDWKAAADFVTRCQNLPGENKMEWASGDPENKGGFVYYPGFSNAGEVDLPDGKKALRSYGTMSYAGLLSFIYADVKRDDPRVNAALEWLEKNYTIEENPGMGPQGLYYYLHLMTKALLAAGVETLETKDGKKIDWKRDVATKLINLQKGDGQWVNETGRWMESDPALVTSYGVLTLSQLFYNL